jgi:hypothetical protein
MLSVSRIRLRWSGLCWGKHHDSKGSNGKRGLIAFKFVRSAGEGRTSRRREENQRPPHLTGGHK